MNRILKWWFNRKPYVPAILREVNPVLVNKELAKATAESAQRIDVAARASAAARMSVVSLHESWLKSIQG